MLTERSLNDHGTLSERALIDHDSFTPSRVGLRRRGSGSGSDLRSRSRTSTETLAASSHTREHGWPQQRGRRSKENEGTNMTTTRVLYCTECSEPFSHHWDRPRPATCPFCCSSSPVERLLVDPADVIDTRPLNRTTPGGFVSIPLPAEPV